MSAKLRVLMYSTAVCPYCVRAEQLLRARGVDEIEKVRVDLDPERRAGHALTPQPPSTARTCPVTNRDSGDSR